MIRDSFLPADLRAWSKTLAARYGLRAGVRLGQHFLIDKRVLAATVARAQLTPEVPVLEVGGGFGVLTLALLAAGARVVTVELDVRLAEGLKKLAPGAQLMVVAGDILKLSDAELSQALRAGSGEFDIVANLPYEISGAFLRRFLSGNLRPRRMVLLLQREVALRLAARPGKMSLLSLACQLNARVEVVRVVPPAAFWPAPRVSSALVAFGLFTAAERAVLLAGASEDVLWRLARVGFAARRKLLKNNLMSALPLPAAALARAFSAAHLTPTARAQELSIAQWVALARALEQV